MLGSRRNERRSEGAMVSLFCWRELTSPGTHRAVIGKPPGTHRNSPGVHRELTGYTLEAHRKFIGNLSETHRELTGNPTGFYPAVKHDGTRGKTHRKHKMTTLEMPGKHTRKWLS